MLCLQVSWEESRVACFILFVFCLKGGSSYVRYAHFIELIFTLFMFFILSQSDIYIYIYIEKILVILSFSV